jgi:hypothetical protein
LTLSFFRKSNGVIQIFLGTVSLVDESQLPPIQTFNRARGLRRSQIAAVTEGGEEITFARIFQLGVVAGNGAEVARPV